MLKILLCAALATLPAFSDDHRAVQQEGLKTTRFPSPVKKIALTTVKHAGLLPFTYTLQMSEIQDGLADKIILSHDYGVWNSKWEISVLNGTYSIKKDGNTHPCYSPVPKEREACQEEIGRMQVAVNKAKQLVSDYPDAQTNAKLAQLTKIENKIAEISNNITFLNPFPAYLAEDAASFFNNLR